MLASLMQASWALLVGGWVGWLAYPGVFPQGRGLDCLDLARSKRFYAIPDQACVQDILRMRECVRVYTYSHKSACVECVWEWVSTRARERWFFHQAWFSPTVHTSQRAVPSPLPPPAHPSLPVGGISWLRLERQMSASARRQDAMHVLVRIGHFLHLQWLLVLTLVKCVIFLLRVDFF